MREPEKIADGGRIWRAPSPCSHGDRTDSSDAPLTTSPLTGNAPRGANPASEVLHIPSAGSGEFESAQRCSRAPSEPLSWSLLAIAAVIVAFFAVRA